MSESFERCHRCDRKVYRMFCDECRAIEDAENEARRKANADKAAQESEAINEKGL